MSYEENCSVCGQKAILDSIPKSTTYIVNCKTCGKYISEQCNDSDIKNMSDEKKAMISAFTRELFEYENPPPQLNIIALEGEMERIIERYRNKSVKEKLDSLILYMAKKSDYFGELFELKLYQDYPITYSRNIQEFKNICALAIQNGYLERIQLSDQESREKLTWQGLLYADEIKELGPLSKKCFVAMSCSEDMNKIYEEGIKPAITEAAYEPVFIEMKEHNEKICDLIIAEIRSCKFLVADVTHQKQNVYYEAGFAHGLNREVIFTCRSDQEEECQFDTRQYNHIFWENPEDIKKKLLHRIKATIL